MIYEDIFTAPPHPNGWKMVLAVIKQTRLQLFRRFQILKDIKIALLVQELRHFAEQVIFFVLGKVIKLIGGGELTQSTLQVFRLECLLVCCWSSRLLTIEKYQAQVFKIYNIKKKQTKYTHYYKKRRKKWKENTN